MADQSTEYTYDMDDDRSKNLTDWPNEPTLGELRQDYQDAKPALDEHVEDVNRWLENLNIEGRAKPPKKKNRSSVQPKLIRKNNEWRYPALSEPFLSSDKIFDVNPATYEDRPAAHQNSLVLNYQFNQEIDRVSFIDEYVRAAVDEGTVFVRVGWEFEEAEQEVPYPVYSILPARSTDQMEVFQRVTNFHPDDLTDEWKAALRESELTGQIMIPIQTDTEVRTETVTIKNRPTLEVCDYRNLVIDPSCQGDLQKAKFVVYSFETSLSELEAAGIYENLDAINVEGVSSNAGDGNHHVQDDSAFQFTDNPRKRLIAYEYWGYWDLHDTGVVEPFVATWVGDTMIRMEENPFPDMQIPFVSAQYLPVRKELYGEPDGELLEENQKIVGAMTRGIVDVMARAANGQTGMRKDMLDVTNRRKFQNGEDYEFNQTVDPRQGVHMHTYPELPQSTQLVLEMQRSEAESMTGVRPFGATSSGHAISGNASATEARGVLDAASKREVSILRRLADGIKRIGHKIISMNQEFLSDEEIIRVTNDEFIAIKREALAGKFDLVLNISTIEEDNAKAQELAFMLQTIGPDAEPKMRYMIMSDIAELRKMPGLAKRLREYEPQPDPIAVEKAQLENEKLKVEIAKEQAEIEKIYSETGLNTTKAGTEQTKQGNIQADTDLKNLDYVEEESGVKHARDLQKDGAQARANLTRDLINNQFQAATAAGAKSGQ